MNRILIWIYNIFKAKDSCFYCGKSLIDVPYDNYHQKTHNSKSSDHYYPKKHPKYSKGGVVTSCIQCNTTKGAGDPEKFIVALQIIPLPKWGVKGLTSKWYKETGYRCGEYK